MTLEVSRLSGWLNAAAVCRESNAIRGEVWAERRENVGRRQRTRGMHGERARL